MLVSYRCVAGPVFKVVTENKGSVGKHQNPTAGNLRARRGLLARRRTERQNRAAARQPGMSNDLLPIVSDIRGGY
jgi:hypothetical protein